MTLLQIALGHKYGDFFKEKNLPKSDPLVLERNLRGVCINKKIHF